MSSKIFIKEGDIVNFPCDALIFKFARHFYGADEFIASLVSTNPLKEISPSVGNYVLLPTNGKVAAKNVIFVGVVSLYEFDYGKIREFAYRSLQILTKLLPEATHVAMTMHGVGYGLDEKESFLAQIGGIFDAFRDNQTPSTLKRITIIERNHRRATRLRKLLKEHLPEEATVRKQKSAKQISASRRVATAGLKSKTKPHVFVAMPFSDDMEDVYIFGIQAPVNAAGFLCERVDMTIFFGDILNRIKSRIETSTLVIAELTGANPNVYLEVGYAWGKDVPTLFLAKTSDELKFDVKNQRCIVYKNISDLAKKLSTDLAALK